MSENLPPPRCDHCGEVVWQNDRYRWITATREPEAEEDERVEPEVVSQGVVHEHCWSDWAKTHGVEG